jgi:hypothetical protein
MAYKILVRKPKWRRLLVRPTHAKGDIKMDLKETG